MLGFLIFYVNLFYGKLNMFLILFIFVLGKINENLKKCIVVRFIQNFCNELKNYLKIILFNLNFLCENIERENKNESMEEVYNYKN